MREKYTLAFSTAAELKSSNRILQWALAEILYRNGWFFQGQALLQRHRILLSEAPMPYPPSFVITS